jgi:hypothetical protein
MDDAMSKVGTCAHTFEIQEAYVVNAGRTTRIDDPQQYQCTWGDKHHMPPPLIRAVATNHIHPGDCDVCPHYQPAAGKIT